VYPDDATLAEVGRIAIAAGRLDAALGTLWWHLAPERVAELEARTAPAGKVREQVKQLATQRLDPVHAEALRSFITEVKEAQEERNEVMHSRWLLRGPDSMRTVSEFLSLSEVDRHEYLSHWERDARRSDDWRLQRNRSLELSEALDLDQLTRLERRLSRAEDVAVQWHFRIASMRETGSPKGWRGPDVARRGAQPLPPGAVTGAAAIEALEAFAQRHKQSGDSDN